MNQSCWTCKHCYGSSDVLGDEHECHREDDLSPDQLERADAVEWHPERMPAICGIYEVLPASCGICGEDLGARHQWYDEHSDLWVHSLYGDPYPVCSLACKAIGEAREQQVVDPERPSPIGPGQIRRSADRSTTMLPTTLHSTLAASGRRSRPTTIQQSPV